MQTQTDNILNIPADGSRYLYDVSINRDVWIAKVLGHATDGEPLQLAYVGEDLPQWDNDPEILAAVKNNAMGSDYPDADTIEEQVRDNVYNNEQDFDNVFTWTVYAPTTSGDWVYAPYAYVAICRHVGGDPRGAYHCADVYRVDDALAENGFCDWVVGWYVVDAETNSPIERAEDYAVGYAQHPTSELEQALDNEDPDDPFTWKDGAYRARINGRAVVCHPELPFAY